jgi:hypothetical protein
MSARWSKWWWLQISSIPAWSADERRAAVVLAVTGLVGFLITWTAFAFLIAAMKFELGETLILSFLIVLITLGRTIARVADNVFPVIVAKGDEEAARRVGVLCTFLTKVLAFGGRHIERWAVSRKKKTS